MAKISTPQTQPQSSPLITLEDIRKELYELRKFEVQNLWQRSIFLAAFIAILFSGYGHLVDKLLSESEKWLTDSYSQSLSIHIICSLLSFLGSIFAVIWVMMAKGSKAWYEIHERKIRIIEKEIQIREEYRMKRGAPWKLNNSLFSCEPGSFSVSRINILLGQILLIAWEATLCIHITFSIMLIWNTSNYSILTKHSIIIFFTLLPFMQLYLSHWLKKAAHSHAIISPEEEGWI
jgi:hypothetical protein